MNKVACQYAVIRFLPYAETGEFANVGVALACPNTGFFDARLMPARKTARITGFFDKLDKRVYRNAITYMGQELDRVGELIRARITPDAAFVRNIFAEMTRPREALLRFGDTRVILADNPAKTLNNLFATLVERDFADRQYNDKLLVRSVRETLHKANLRRYFHATNVGNNDLFLHVPFVHEHGGRQQLAIKPVDLAKAEANLVYKTGGLLTDQVRRFRKHELLPEAMLFPVGLPDSSAGATWRAAMEIMDELNLDSAVQAVPAADKSAIVQFAHRAVIN
jgi:hypothetical protein